MDVKAFVSKLEKSISEYVHSQSESLPFCQSAKRHAILGHQTPLFAGYIYSSERLQLFLYFCPLHAAGAWGRRELGDTRVKLAQNLFLKNRSFQPNFPPAERRQQPSPSDAVIGKALFQHVGAWEKQMQSAVILLFRNSGPLLETGLRICKWGFWEASSTEQKTDRAMQQPLLWCSTEVHTAAESAGEQQCSAPE